MAEETTCVILDADTGEALKSAGNVTGRHSPCWTFTVPLALMGFDCGVLIDDNTPRIDYKPKRNPDGSERYASWKEACTPRIWLEDKCGWYPPHVEQAIGPEHLQAYLDKFDYGNRDMSGKYFSHLSSLKISPMEQAQFFRRLLQGSLPVSAGAVAKVRELLVPEPFAEGALYAKRGGDYIDPVGDYQLGWYAGWLERRGKRYAFATYVECFSVYAAAFLAYEITQNVFKNLFAGDAAHAAPPGG